MRNSPWVATVAEWSRYRIVDGLVMSSSSVPLNTHRERNRCTLNLSNSNVLPLVWCGSQSNGMPAQV
ncbi:hypothetical protein TNCV_2725841 [Trichonephila clavipes]|nr:hypothetical protein TNCV_2725841 [Trichonephila clavipes]